MKELPFLPLLNKKILYLSLAFFLLCAGEMNGQNFRISGTQILDPDGNLFIAKGVNAGGYNYNKSAGNTVNDVDLILDVWKFNLVRINCKMFFNEYNYGYTGNNNMKAIIDTFTQRKCVVLIDGGHERIGSFYEGSELDSLISFYRQLATYTKDNPYVWFDLANEPDNNYGKPGNRQKWSYMMRELIKTIRNTGNNSILLVSGGSWGQDAGGGGCDDVPVSWSHILSWYNDVLEFEGTRYENIAFTFHVYNSWNCSRERMASYLDKIKERNLAVVIGEYGMENDNKSTLEATKHMFELSRERQIGKAVWHWSNGDNNNLVKKISGTTRGTSNNGGGREIDNLTEPSNLTELGTMVWNDNHFPVTGAGNGHFRKNRSFSFRINSNNNRIIFSDDGMSRNEPVAISLYNLNGRVVWQKRTDGSVSEILLPDNLIDKGIYILKARTGSSTATKKIAIW